MTHQLYILQYGLCRYFKGLNTINKIEITSNALECKLFNSQESVNNTQLELLDKYNIYFNIIRL